tara:strand:- start:63 stop:230 length:168 start_codon:yes stop_codon:yes gene_type:complete
MFFLRFRRIIKVFLTAGFIGKIFIWEGILLFILENIHLKLQENHRIFLDNKNCQL